MGRPSQRKGRGGELELCRILGEAGLPVSPGEPVSFGDTPDLVGLPGVHIECKRTERLNLRAAMEQAERDADFFGDGSPAVFHRANRQPWMVTMRLTDWLELYKRGGDGRCTTHGEHGVVHSTPTTKRTPSTASREAGSD